MVLVDTWLARWWFSAAVTLAAVVQWFLDNTFHYIAVHLLAFFIPVSIMLVRAGLTLVLGCQHDFRDCTFQNIK